MICIILAHLQQPQRRGKKKKRPKPRILQRILVCLILLPFKLVRFFGSSLSALLSRVLCWGVGLVFRMFEGVFQGVAYIFVTDVLRWLSFSLSLSLLESAPYLCAWSKLLLCGCRGRRTCRRTSAPAAPQISFLLISSAVAVAILISVMCAAPFLLTLFRHFCNFLPVLG